MNDAIGSIRTRDRLSGSYTDLELASRASSEPETQKSCTEKTIFVSTRVLAALFFTASAGAVVGGVGGLFTGLGINWFMETWFHTVNPEFPIIVAKIGLCSGVGIKVSRGAIKAMLDAFDYNRPLREYLSGLI